MKWLVLVALFGLSCSLPSGPTIGDPGGPVGAAVPGESGEPVAFYGRCVDAVTEQPIEGVKVTIEANTPWWGKAVTDAAGVYVMYGDPGLYTDTMSGVFKVGYIPMARAAHGYTPPPAEFNFRLTPESRGVGGTK